MVKKVRGRKERTAAVITIHGAGKMTARGRRDIALWLRRHADHLVKHGKEYTDGRFTGRFIYS